MATTTCVIKSGGVITAATINTITMACFLYFLKNEGVIMPNLEKIRITTGNKNNKPVKKTVETMVLK